MVRGATRPKVADGNIRTVGLEQPIGANAADSQAGRLAAPGANARVAFVLKDEAGSAARGRLG